MFHFNVAEIQAALASLMDESALRWAQRQAARALARDVAAGKRKLYIEMPTGSGKTAIFWTFLEALYTLGLLERTLIVAPGKLLLKQIRTGEAEKYAPTLFRDGKIGTFRPSRPDEQNLVTLATYWSATKGLQSGAISEKDLAWVIQDEAHAVLSELRQDVFSKLKAVQIALTATPHYNARKNLEAMGYFKSYVLTFKKAVETGILCSYRNTVVQAIDNSVDLDRIKLSADGEFDEKELDRALINQSAIAVVTKFFRNWADPESGRRLTQRSGIIFCNSIAHAKFVADSLNEELRDQFLADITPFAAIWGDMPQKQIDDLIERHRTGKIAYLCSKDYLIQGYDNRAIDVGVNLAPTRSFVKAAQRGGRLMRDDPDNPDKIADIFDLQYGDGRKQILFRDTVGMSSAETKRRQRARIRADRAATPEEREQKAGTRKNRLDEVKKIEGLIVHYEDSEIDRLVADRERRRSIQKHPWLAQVDPDVHMALIRGGMTTFQSLSHAVHALARQHDWYESPSKNGHLKQGALMTALRGQHKTPERDRYHFSEIAIAAALGMRVESVFGSIRNGGLNYAPPGESDYTPDYYETLYDDGLPRHSAGITNDDVVGAITGMFDAAVNENRPTDTARHYTGQNAAWMAAAAEDLVATLNDDVLNPRDEITLRRHFARHYGNDRPVDEYTTLDTPSTRESVIDGYKVRGGNPGVVNAVWLPENQHDALVRKEMKAAVAVALRQLNPREERILRLRFGIGSPEMTLEEIGNAYGVTRERIRQMESKALRKLKHPARSRRLAPFA